MQVAANIDGVFIADGCARGAISGDMRKSFSFPPSMFQEGGCTPFGLKSVTNRTGGLDSPARLAVAAFALFSIKLRKGSGTRAPAAQLAKPRAIRVRRQK